MSEIKVVNNPPREILDESGVYEWPVWTHEAAGFPWQYSEQEPYYFLQGSVTVTPDGGSPVKLGEGDLVTFAKGMECHWLIHEAVRKYYRFG